MRVEALAKYVRVTPRKARLEARLVAGLPVDQALIRLGYTEDLKRIGLAPRHGATEIAKVIKSAAANAEHNFNLDRSELVVERIDVDPGSVIKRFRPKPRGRAGSIFKRTSHLRAWVTDDRPGQPGREPLRRTAAAAPPKPAKPAAKKVTTAKATTTKATAVKAKATDVDATVTEDVSQEVAAPAPAKKPAAAKPKADTTKKTTPAAKKKAAEEKE